MIVVLARLSKHGFSSCSVGNERLHTEKVCRVVVISLFEMTLRGKLEILLIGYISCVCVSIAAHDLPESCSLLSFSGMNACGSGICHILTARK